MTYTSPSILSPSSPLSTSICLSGDILGLLETYLPLVSPFSPPPSSPLPAEGDLETYLAPLSESEPDESDLPRCFRRSGEEPREEGGVREGDREEGLVRFGLESEGSSSFFVSLRSQEERIDVLREISVEPDLPFLLELIFGSDAGG